MNCETIDSILDDHRFAHLSAADRQVVATHLRGCARCADGWAVNDALSGERIPKPPPQLFAAVLGRIAAARARAPAARRRMWAAAAGAAAAVAIVAVAARYFVPAPVPGADDAAPAVAAVLPTPRFVAGRDYEVLPGPVVPAATDRIEVVEFFMYECRPCYAFEPELTRWDAQARDYVSVVRVPAIFSPDAELHARAYYTAAALGKSDAMHAAFYEEIHDRGNQLSSSGALAKLFASFGVDPGMFDAVFNSSEIDARVQRAAALGRAYRIRATPSLVVAGRYSTNPGLAGSALLAVVDELVAGEAARDTTRWLAEVNGGGLRADFDFERVARDPVEAYSWLLEAADDPAVPPFAVIALEHARAGLSAEQIADAERRYERRRAGRGDGGDGRL